MRDSDGQVLYIQCRTTVAYVIRRPCSDFTDMLRRHINCRIIIIIIIIIIIRSVSSNKSHWIDSSQQHAM